jgi:hypothetical protein
MGQLQQTFILHNRSPLARHSASALFEYRHRGLARGLVAVW